MYAVDSFSVSGFGQSGDGKIVSEGTVTIDATAENKAVITIPKITLDS